MKKVSFLFALLVTCFFACEKTSEQDFPTNATPQNAEQGATARSVATYVISSLSADEMHRIEMTIDINENHDAFVSRAYFPAEPDDNTAIHLVGSDYEHHFEEDGVLSFSSNIPDVNFQWIDFDLGGEDRTIVNGGSVTLGCNCSGCSATKMPANDNTVNVTCVGSCDRVLPWRRGCKVVVQGTSGGIGSAIIQANTITYLH